MLLNKFILNIFIMSICCVSDCKKIGYHRFPKNETKRNAWKNAINKPDLIITNQRLCTKHFSKNDYKFIPVEGL